MTRPAVRMDDAQPADRLEGLAAALFQPMGADGVYARTGAYEAVVEALGALISRHRDPACEVFRFPPVMSRAVLETSGYLKSFPNLLGCVCCMDGGEAEIRGAVGRFAEGGTYTDQLSVADLVLTPARCCSTWAATASGASPRGRWTGCSRSACANTSASARPPRSPTSARPGSPLRR